MALGDADPAIWDTIFTYGSVRWRGVESAFSVLSTLPSSRILQTTYVRFTGSTLRAERNWAFYRH